MKIPLLSDLNKKVSSDYGVLIEDAGIALRLVYCIKTIYKVKTQYVQVSNIIDVSIKRPVSALINSCGRRMYGHTCLIEVKSALVIEEH